MDAGQMIEVAGVVYNRDHIVKVDISRPDLARIYTTPGGMDEYTGETARQIAAFFSPPAETAPVVPTESKRKPTR